MRRLFGGGRAGDGSPGRRGTPADLLVVGLGNPGQEFAGTRHNAGADTVALLSSRHGGRLKAMKGQRAEVAEVTIGGARVVLAVPTTYMNDSGAAVAPLLRRFGIDEPDRLLVIHDELDLPTGRMRVKEGGGTAGHNGLKSVQAHVHSADFGRIRIGVGKPPGPEDGADYVLHRPSRRDRELLDQSVIRAADAAEIVATAGLAEAMNASNGSS